jgi:hypothetical protein
LDLRAAPHGNKVISKPQRCRCRIVHAYTPRARINAQIYFAGTGANSMQNGAGFKSLRQYLLQRLV